MPHSPVAQEERTESTKWLRSLASLQCVQASSKSCTAEVLVVVKGVAVLLHLAHEGREELNELGHGLVDVALNYTDSLIQDLSERAANLGAELFDQLVPDWMVDAVRTLVRFEKGKLEEIGRKKRVM